MPQSKQPFLHDLVAVLAAPTQVWSDRSGSVDSTGPEGGAQGVLHADVRLLDRIRLRVDGRPAEHVATELTGSEVTFTYLVRRLTPDLAGAGGYLRLERVRRVDPGSVGERLSLSSRLDAQVRVEVTIEFGGDGASIEVIKTGGPTGPRPFPAPVESGIRWAVGEITAELAGAVATWTRSPDELTVTARWVISVPAHGRREVGWHLDLQDSAAPVAAGSRGLAGWLAPAAPDHRLGPWVERSLADLDALVLSRPDTPDDIFLGAGAPWYLTLFGRDSLWAARMLLPVDLGLAHGTLRTLARLQGRAVDRVTAEQPGKIIHELRRSGFELGGMSLPPLYYGTVDATPLWVCLLHDAWRAGLGDDLVFELVPHLERALTWLRTYADAGGHGFCSYLDVGGHGLANQGWKDSADAVRFADGRVAAGPIALCEVQGYAYEAAMAGAELLEMFGRPGADDSRSWAASLAQRFRAGFWCGSGEERYPALALDGHDRPVDSLTSNIGHLLGTGLLNAAEEGLVADRVSSPELDSGLGLRTMSTRDAGYDPLSYHCGSVWPHDTAIVIAGLVRAGLRDRAGGLIEGLLRASVAFDQRLPELFSGEGRPVPYPASCRPQAWSAAAAIVVARAGQE